MDDTALDDLLAASRPEPVPRSVELHDTLAEMAARTEPLAHPRRRLRRTAVAGFALAGTLAIAGTAAAGGMLPESWTPWEEHPFPSGRSCQVAFWVEGPADPGLVQELTEAERSAATLAAQRFLSTFNAGPIDLGPAAESIKSLSAEAKERTPADEWEDLLPTDLDLFAMMQEASTQVRASLTQQGHNPDAVSVGADFECPEQP